MDFCFWNCHDMYNNNKLCQIHVHLFWKKLSPQIFSMSLSWAIHNYFIFWQIGGKCVRTRLSNSYKFAINRSKCKIFTNCLTQTHFAQFAYTPLNCSNILSYSCTLLLQWVLSKQRILLFIQIKLQHNPMKTNSLCLKLIQRVYWILVHSSKKGTVGSTSLNNLLNILK